MGDGWLMLGMPGDTGNTGESSEWLVGRSTVEGTRCGKELMAWLGGDCPTTDAARCCAVGQGCR